MGSARIGILRTPERIESTPVEIQVSAIRISIYIYVCVCMRDGERISVWSGT